MSLIPFPLQDKSLTFKVAALDQAYLEPGGELLTDFLQYIPKVIGETRCCYPRLIERPVYPSQTCLRLENILRVFICLLKNRQE